MDVETARDVLKRTLQPSSGSLLLLSLLALVNNPAVLTIIAIAAICMGYGRANREKVETEEILVIGLAGLAILAARTAIPHGIPIITPILSGLAVAFGTYLLAYAATPILLPKKRRRAKTKRTEERGKLEKKQTERNKQKICAADAYFGIRAAVYSIFLLITMLLLVTTLSLLSVAPEMGVGVEDARKGAIALTVALLLEMVVLSTNILGLTAMEKGNGSRVKRYAMINTAWDALLFLLIGTSIIWELYHPTQAHGVRETLFALATVMAWVAMIAWGACIVKKSGIRRAGQ